MYPRSSCCVPKLAFLSRMVSSMFHPEVSAALLFTLIFELVEGLFSGVKCPLCEQLGQDFITTCLYHRLDVLKSHNQGDSGVVLRT